MSINHTHQLIGLHRVYTSGAGLLKMAESTYSTETVIRGYHVYKNIWTAVLGEELFCNRERFNSADPFAVSVVKASTIVGHVPRRISPVCSLFLRRNGTIRCRVNGSRHHSLDLPQGGLEIPCILTFEGATKYVEKVQTILESKPRNIKIESQSPPSKKIKIEPQSPPSKQIKIEPHSVDSKVSSTWAQLGGIVLSSEDRATIIDGDKLNDKHINFAHQMLKKQFLNLNGCQSTLLQAKQPLANCEQVIQIVHARGDHWMALSTFGADANLVNVYDSVYHTLDEDTESVIKNLLKKMYPLQIRITNIQKQEGSRDCGLFSIAAITAVAFCCDPNATSFDQSAMRPHLVQCIENNNLLPFPLM